MARPGDPARIPVLVCGELTRGDDAVAFAAVDAMPEASRELADVRTCGQLEVDQLLDLPDGTPCVIVDAAIGVEPGSVVVIGLDEIAGRKRGTGPRSSHTLPVDQVLALASTMRGASLDGVFVGIGGERFDFGAPLSPRVAAGLPRLTAAVAAEVERLAARTGTPSGARAEGARAGDSGTHTEERRRGRRSDLDGTRRAPRPAVARPQQ